MVTSIKILIDDECSVKCVGSSISCWKLYDEVIFFILFGDDSISQLKKGKRKVQGVPQSQTAALPRPQEEEETDKSKQAQTEQTYEKHY